MGTLDDLQKKVQILPPMPTALVTADDPDTTVECLFEHKLPGMDSVFYVDPMEMAVPVFVNRLLVGTAILFAAVPSQAKHGVCEVFLPKGLDVTADIVNQTAPWYGEVHWRSHGMDSKRHPIWSPEAVILSRFPSEYGAFNKLYARSAP